MHQIFAEKQSTGEVKIEEGRRENKDSEMESKRSNLNI